MQNVVIDEEFKSLLPILDETTYGSLEENIISNGCRDALVLWNGILIDGYNRYNICIKHDIPFETISKSFKYREEVLIWIISNQVSRRNLTQIQLSHYRGLHYRADRKIIKNENGKNQHSEVLCQDGTKPHEESTAARLAKQYRVSPRTISRDSRISSAIDAIGEVSPDAKTKILIGEVVLDKKALQELSSMPTEELETIAVKIKDGTYGKDKSKTTPPTMEENQAAPVSDEIRRLDKFVSIMANNFRTELRKLSDNTDTTKVRAAFKA